MTGAWIKVRVSVEHNLTSQTAFEHKYPELSLVMVVATDLTLDVQVLKYIRFTC